MAFGSPRMASLTSRRNITSRADSRRVLPVSVTGIFCRMTPCRIAPTERLPLGRPLGLPEWSCPNLTGRAPRRPRAVQSSSASAASATGFTVGWAASASKRLCPNALTPAYAGSDRKTLGRRSTWSRPQGSAYRRKADLDQIANMAPVDANIMN